MDAKTLAKVVQLVVKEEVTKIVKKEMATMKKQIVSEVKRSLQENQPITEFVSSNPEDIDSLVANALQTERKKQLSNDPLLNDILNETKAFGQPEEYPTMGGGTYGANNAQGFVSNYRQMMEKEFGGGSGNMAPTTDTEGRPTNNTNLPPAVQKALTRDYTELVKKMTGK